ncbi:hypothetical protein [Enhygromyxa salina]|nr:hypothetical protein [Enhygromyxa salina]
MMTRRAMRPTCLDERILVDLCTWPAKSLLWNQALLAKVMGPLAEGGLRDLGTESFE